MEVMKCYSHLFIEQLRATVLNDTIIIKWYIQTEPIPGAARSKPCLRPLACWDCGFESRLGHVCLSLVSVVCCQVEVSETGWSLVQRSPTECGVYKVCDRETSKNEEA
jgi:hypothetical protein